MKRAKFKELTEVQCEGAAAASPAGQPCEVRSPLQVSVLQAQGLSESGKANQSGVLPFISSRKTGELPFSILGRNACRVTLWSL